jgi:hypothetical protein
MFSIDFLSRLKMSEDGMGKSERERRKMGDEDITDKTDFLEEIRGWMRIAHPLKSSSVH